jgi:hypothetical protein
LSDRERWLTIDVDEDVFVYLVEHGMSSAYDRHNLPIPAGLYEIVVALFSREGESISAALRRMFALHRGTGGWTA